MNGALIDSSVILDVFTEDPKWGEWSENMLQQYSDSNTLYINPIIYSEISIGFAKIEELEKAVAECGFQLLPIPKEALFLAGKAFLQYKRRLGSKLLPLPDFYIGAHAAILDLTLITQDHARIKSYFPSVNVIFP